MKITESKTYIAIPPGFTIKELLDDQDKSVKEFAHLMGLTEEDATSLIEGDVELTGDVAVRLEAVVGMNTRFWLGLERNYREKLLKVAEENAHEAQGSAGDYERELAVQANFAV